MPAKTSEQHIDGPSTRRDSRANHITFQASTFTYEFPSIIKLMGGATIYSSMLMTETYKQQICVQKVQRARNPVFRMTLSA